MIFRASSSKGQQTADPFGLSRRQVVESLHSMHQLEARTDGGKKRKLRRSRWGLRVLRLAGLVVSLASLTAFGNWVYKRAFFDNPDFQLKHVELAIPEGFLGTRILEVAGVEQGMKMMAIDLQGMRDRLAEIPLVSRVEVSREFPDKLIIVIEEARPVAWLSCPSKGIDPFSAEKGWLIEEHGALVRCETMNARFSSLPVIKVRDVYVSESGEMLDPKVVNAALELMELSQIELKGEGLEIVELEAQNAYSMRARYSNRMEVVFGLTEPERALKDLGAILARTRADGRLLATVNLRVRRNIPVTFYEPPVAKPVEIKEDGEAAGEEKSGKKAVSKG